MKKQMKSICAFICMLALLFNVLLLSGTINVLGSPGEDDLSPVKLFDFSNTAGSWTPAWGSDYPWYAADIGKNIAIYQSISAVDPDSSVLTPDGDSRSLKITYYNDNAGWPSAYWFYVGTPTADKTFKTFDLSEKNIVKFDIYIPDTTALTTYSSLYKGKLYAFLFDEKGPGPSGHMLPDLVVGWNTIKLEIGDSGIDFTKFRSIGIYTDSAWGASLNAIVNTAYAPLVFNIDNVRAVYDPELPMPDLPLNPPAPENDPNALSLFTFENSSFWNMA